jgi:peptidyl-prolyl cis-trans isomerase D
MLQKIRDKITGWFAIVFLAAIAIVFIFWGIQFESSVNVAAATVDGEKIPVEQVRRAWQDRQGELQQITRGELPPEIVGAEQQRLLDEFVRRELLLQRAEKLGYRVSDRDLAEAIARIPALQVDGQFSRDRYAALLRSQGRSEADFEADFRRDLAINQMRNAMAVSGFVLPGELRRRMELEGEVRDVDLALMPAAGFAASVSLSPADVEAWYKEHEADFRTPESVDLQYVRLELADVAAGIEVTDEALRAYYDQVAGDRFVSTERRQARHILVEAGSDDAAARARAEDLARRARAGEDFAALAAQYSDDPGSKGQGGDLGWATRDTFVPAFADALFGMQPGAIEGPVKTQFGYHVIRLEQVEAGQQRSFDEVRGELEADYRRDQAQSRFYERSQQLADEAFASLDELASVAQKLGLRLRTVERFTREGGGDLGTERKLIEAVFSDEVLQGRRNSPAIDLGDESVVVLRVTEHRLAAQRPLDEVRGEAEAALRNVRAREAAEAAARTAAGRVASGESWASVVEALGLQSMGVRPIARTDEALPPGLLEAIFAVPAPASGGGSAGVAALPGGDSALFLVSGSRPGTLDAADGLGAMTELAQRGASQATGAEFSAYVGELERNAEITRNPKLFE